jgi:hypothetical protein
VLSPVPLLAIFTQGRKPEGYAFNSAALRMQPSPDCLFSMFHMLSVDEDSQDGLVLKLRSLPPGK